MPHLDGIGVIAHVQKVTPHTPVIVFTADITQDAEEKARSLGVREYINKPLDFTDLLQRIARVFTHTVHLERERQ
jgi:CheY-like chemotaxis protein